MGISDASTAISKLRHSVRQYGGRILGTQGKARPLGFPNLVHSPGATSEPHVRATHRPLPAATESHRIPAVWQVCRLPATIETGLWRAVFAEASILGHRR